MKLSENCALVTLALLAITIMLPLSAIVVNDYRITKGYQPSLCSGTTLSEAKVDTSGLCGHGTVRTCVSHANGTCVVPMVAVELFYPPIAHHHLVCEKSDKSRAWLASLGGVNSFSCRVENEAMGLRKGISTLYHQIIGWGFMLTVCIILIIALIVFAFWYYCRECKCLSNA